MTKLGDLFYVTPPEAQDALEIMQVAHGIRPMSDLEPTIWYDSARDDVKILS